MMKRSIKVAMLLCVVAVLLGVLSLKTVGAKAAPSNWRVSQNRFSSNTCKWSVVPSLNGNSNSALSGVATVSANDVWAVGGSGSQLGAGYTLIEHWNGTQWQVVTSPSPDLYNTLTGVAAVSASNVWAVGWHANGSTTQTLIEHWNGTQWSVVTSPSPASINNELYGVAAVSASDVWAVGFLSTNTATGAVDQTLVEHWNGTNWSVVKSSNPGSGSDHLAGVAAVSSNNVWTVGNYANSDGSGGTLAEHWNGTSWSVVKSPSPGSGGDLTGVSAVSASNVWAVGYTSINSTLQTLTEHWNGTSWQVVKSSNVGQHPSFWAVAAISASNVWAVGSDGTNTKFNQTLTERWNGKQWSVVASPSPGSFNTQLLSVAAASTTDVWAVGVADSNTLTEHYHC
ncbi:MAG TPA: hypothetical protein VKU38_16500 [Ktedonobacteraceae bacterium]|nr:hypothetical protein [Ktedonobacteraceae bacterium]